MQPRARLDAQVVFLAEADRPKSVLRGTTQGAGSRRENSGRHGWYTALYPLVLRDQAGPGVSINPGIAMLLIHGLTEIDAGDAPIHCTHDTATIALTGSAAATRSFGLLPRDRAATFRALADQCEAAQTPDAIPARSLDRAQPVVADPETGGGTRPGCNATRAQLETRVGDKIRHSAPALRGASTARPDQWFGS